MYINVNKVLVGSNSKNNIDTYYNKKILFFLLFARLRSLNLTLASIRKPPPTNLALTSPIEKPTAGQLI